MKILVIDGQGGRLGRTLIEGIREACPQAEITAVGTNSIATQNMLASNCADHLATGENAVLVACRSAQVIAGPFGITAANHAPTAPPIMPHTNGFIKRKLIPKIAGSVIPSEADSEDGSATDFVFWFFTFSATARQAPNWAKLAAEAMGIQVLTPVCAIMPR